MIDSALKNNAPLEKAIDVFKYRGDKYPKDMEIGWAVPAKGSEYEHVCRFPYEEAKAFFHNKYRGIFSPASISDILAARRDDIKAFKEKYCSDKVTRLREPDMVCMPGGKWRDAECVYLQEQTMEAQAETNSRYMWSTPYYAEHAYEIVPEPWRSIVSQ